MLVEWQENRLNLKVTHEELGRLQAGDTVGEGLANFCWRVVVFASEQSSIHLDGPIVAIRVGAQAVALALQGIPQNIERPGLRVQIQPTAGYSGVPGKTTSVRPQFGSL